MAATKALIIELRSMNQGANGEPIYSEEQLKEILFAFARDMGCKWRNKRLRDYINMAFYYVQP